MKNPLRSLAIAALAVALFTGSANAAPKDAWITTKAKLALLTTEGVSGTAISVDTIDSRITLHGKVTSDAEKQKAESVVGQIDGVTGVRNLLQVVPAPKENAVKASDDQIKRKVDQALAKDKSLSDSNIDVKSVNNGVVLLAGTAKTLSDHLRAVEVASRVPGVHRVVTEVQGSDQLAVSDVTIENKAHAKKKGGVGATMSDAYITSATKLRLLADGSTPALDINVDTVDGVVTLFGTVPSAAAREAAGKDAAKVSGVKSVRNEIEIVASQNAKAVEVKDDQLKDQVKSSLNGRQEFKDVSVEVKNGVARLSGSVPNDADRLEAAMIARATTGVRSVHEDLTVSD